jgi:hypothetical protein
MKLRDNLPRMVVATAMFVPMGYASAQTYVLDDFESGVNRIVQPQATSSTMKYLWNLYIGGGPTTLVTNDKHDGSRGLRVTHVSGSDFQFQLYTYTENLAGWGNGWQYMRKFVNNPSMNSSGGSPSWPLNRINRLRFWVKLPPGYSQSGTSHNVEIGTYIRDINDSETVAETNNQHYYHFLDLRSHGQWEQVIIDTHPDHQRGANGSTELPDSPQGARSGYNYFDMMTRFYFDIPYSAVAGDHYFDGFEFYQEANPENTKQIRSIHGVYLPNTNGIEVGWRRPKNENGVNHEVRYSFQSIHSIGWASATPAPNGTVVDQGDGGYNGMRWSSTGINVAGKDVVYIAIKPQNSSSFRQIAIPTSSAPLVKPMPPGNVIVN